VNDVGGDDAADNDDDVAADDDDAAAAADHDNDNNNKDEHNHCDNIFCNSHKLKMKRLTTKLFAAGVPAAGRD
jgi:hypothetical protein